MSPICWSTNDRTSAGSDVSCLDGSCIGIKLALSVAVDNMEPMLPSLMDLFRPRVVAL